MKLSKIYSNKKDIFEDILFNPNFNVVFGEVKDPDNLKKDSHNLGKTLLISLIEFLLLKELSPTHFLKEHSKRFEGFEFYLEILLNSGTYLTIKRNVDTPTKISFKKHEKRNMDFRKEESKKWNHYDLPIKKAKQMLDSYLELTAIEDWGYRKGLSYFLRNQNDYQDVFQIEKFTYGDHIDWKPYLAKLLGFDDKKIKSKYDLDDKISKKEEELKSLQNKVSVKVEDYDKLKGTIEIKEAEIDETESQIDIFNFYEEELKIDKNLVEGIEEEIADTNNSLYNIGYEIKTIEESLNTKIKFNLNEIKETFKDCQIHFKESLIKSYEEVLDFKNKIFKERRIYLKERLTALKEKQKELTEKLKKKNIERSNVLCFIREENSFIKFKKLQNILSNQKAELLNLYNQLETLNTIITINQELKSLTDIRDNLVKEIVKDINEGNPIFRNIRKSFSQIMKKVFDKSAIISVKLNQSNNLEFNADVLKSEKSLETTSEGKGTSWKKILCAAFDLSVLASYSERKFFKFVYHDGILEGLDNRKKKNFLEVVKDYIEKYEIQYILTAISDDLPTDKNNQKLQFKEEEIISILTDEGDKGRLFKMPRF